MNIEIITIILFSLLFVALFLGIPVAFAMGGLGVLFMLLLTGPKFLTNISTTAFSSWTSEVLLAIPLFLLMANFLQYSGIGEDLYGTMYKWLGSVPGGLAIGTVIICAIFGAISGISAVATITMGLVALPSMLEKGYDKIIAIGCISAGGTLAILIPPSIIMVLYASFTDESVGKLFIGGIIPGIILTMLFSIYILVMAYLKPESCPPVPKDQRSTWREKLVSLKAILFPILLIFLVLGVIYIGICTPTEAAGIGALGSFLCVLVKKKISWPIMNKACGGALRVTCMILWIVLGAKLFTNIYHALGAPEFILEVIQSISLNRLAVIILMMGILFVLGCFIDPLGIMMITLPVFQPLLGRLDVNLLWFGILFTVNMELSYITPPFGFNLFYMKSVVPSGITMGDIYRSIIPYVFIEIIMIGILIAQPELVLWLPGLMMGR